jgi:hypothetical protein
MPCYSSFMPCIIGYMELILIYLFYIRVMDRLPGVRIAFIGDGPYRYDQCSTFTLLFSSLVSMCADNKYEPPFKLIRIKKY